MIYHVQDTFIFLSEDKVQKPVVLTTSGQSVNNINIYIYIRDLTLAICSQKYPAESGLGYWLFHHIKL